MGGRASAERTALPGPCREGRQPSCVVVLHQSLGTGWSRTQIVGILKPMWHDHPQRTAPRKGDCTGIDAMPEGELSWKLIARMRRGTDECIPRRLREHRRGQYPDLLGSHVSPSALTARAFPSQRGSDFIQGSSICPVRQSWAYGVGEMARREKNLNALANLLSDRSDLVLCFYSLSNVNRGIEPALLHPTHSSMQKIDAALGTWVRPPVKKWQLIKTILIGKKPRI